MKIIIEDCSLPVFKPWLFFKRKKRIREIIEHEKPHIIHMHFVTNALMLRIALKKSKVPRLFQVPGPLHLESKVFRKIEIMLSNKYDYWAPACKKSKALYLKEKIEPNRIFLAYYGGYGGDTVYEYKESSNILHKQFNIPENNILIGMVSYFYKPKKFLGQKRGIKGHEDFIDTIEMLNKTYENVTAVIIGGPWGNSFNYEQKVKKYAKKKKINNIIFTGFRKDIKEIYKEINIAIHPSHSENLGGAAESLAAGVPTIATNIGGFPDIVKDGETGFLCEVSNPQSIVNNVNKILENKEKANLLAINGKELVKELLDIEKTASNVKEIYNKIMEDNYENDILL